MQHRLTILNIVSVLVSPTTASFSASGESKNFSVTSQRRLVTVNSVSGTTYGSWGSTGWEIYPTNLGTGFSQTTSGNTITVKASANSGSSRSGTLSVRCTGDTSETASANLSQSGATTTTTTEYEFSVSPTSLSFTKDGGNQTVSIVSRSRPKYTNDINGEVSYGNWSAVSYTASSTNSAFSSTTPTGTGTNSASVSVGVNTGAARSATITYTQSGSGTKKTVSCSQAVGTQTRTVRDYSFSANPTSLSFDASGGTKSVTVTSQYRDGTQSSTDGGNNWSSTSWGSWQTASYTGTVDNTGGGAFSGSGNSVTAGANSSTSSRSGNLRLSQTRSGIQENGNSWPSPSNINVPLNQERKKEDVYVFLVSPPSITFNANGGERTLSITSTKNDSVIGYSYSWKAMLSQFTFSNGTISASSAGTLGRNDTLTLTQNESGKTATINVSQSGSGGGGEILDDCTITVKYISTGASANAIHVNADKTPTSDLTINITASYTKPDNSKTYSGKLISYISKGSTSGSNIYFSDLIDDVYNWDGNGTCRVNFVTVSPTKDNTYNYNTKVTEI